MAARASAPVIMVSRTSLYSSPYQLTTAQGRMQFAAGHQSITGRFRNRYRPEVLRAFAGRN
jgi:hypothetical protein